MADLALELRAAQVSWTKTRQEHGITIPRIIRGLLTAMMIITVGVWASPASADPAPADTSTTDASLAPGADAALRTSWSGILSHSVNLGRSEDSAVGVIAQLRTDAAPRLLEQWAAVRGLAVTWDPGNDWAEVTGGAAPLGRALGVAVDEFRAPDGHRFYATTAPAHPPTADVAAMGSIGSYGRFTPLDVPSGGLPPSELRQAYDATPLISQDIEGQGETIVFFEVDGFKQSDLNQFAAHYGLPPISVTVVGGQAGSPTGETELDLEAAHSVAPAARLVYFNFSTTTASGMTADFNRVASQFPGAIWSMSIGACETEWGFDGTDFTALESALEKAGAGGTTIFAASGDAGGLECTPPADFGDPPQGSFYGVNVPADFPAVVAVGGTRLSVTAGGAYEGEQAWTESLVSQGSSGGVSAVWKPPTYQNGPGTGSYGSEQPGRQVPDVAAIADPATGAATYIDGSPAVAGGTSLAVPVWAGFMALMDQYLAGLHLPAVGLANLDLYRLAAEAQRHPPFHDITQGGNALYSATPGYNMVTGLGSPDVWNLARDLAQQEAGQ